MHFNWTQLIPGVGHEYSHVATLLIVSSLIMLTGLVARLSLGSGESSVVPTGKFSVRGIFEVFTEYTNFSQKTNMITVSLIPLKITHFQIDCEVRRWPVKTYFT